MAQQLVFRTAGISDMCDCGVCSQKRLDAAKANAVANAIKNNDATSTADRSAPDPYAADVKRLRAAESTPESQFAEGWAAERTREMEATTAALDATASARHLKTLSAEELAPYAAPNGYDIALRALKLAEKAR